MVEVTPITETNEPEEPLTVPGESPVSEESKEPLETTTTTTTNSTLPLPETKDEVLLSSPKQSKLLAMGTPVSIRYSPYNSLPNLEKFASNMGDLELFENLPNSTGAFQKMKSLLNKVRNAFNKKK